MKVKIFTEATSTTGYGHVIRCSSLYFELEKRNIDVEFIINGSDVLNKILPNVQKKFTNWLDEKKLDKLLIDCDYAIIDSYLASSVIYETISKNVKNALYIDDFQRIKYPQGVIVNPGIEDKSNHYEKSNTTCVLSGPKYALLRPEFINTTSCTVKREKKVLILMGGTDVLNLTPQIIKYFSDYHPSWNIEVVIGDNKKIQRINSNNVRTHNGVSATKMKELMVGSEVVISAAGQTLFELLLLNILFFPILVADNQLGNLKSLKEKFSDMVSLDARGSQDITLEMIEKFPMILKESYRESFFKRLNSFIDGQGAIRVIDSLLRKKKH